MTDANIPTVLVVMAEEVVHNETVQRTFVDWLLLSSGLVTAITVLFGAFAWLVWPRLKAYLVKELVQPIQATHKSVTVNGGLNNPPTLLDKIHTQGKQLEHLAHAVKSNDARTKDIGDKVDLLSELVQDSRDELANHETQSKNYLGQVEVVLRGKGIELPSANQERT